MKKKQILALFRKGNKLMRRAINAHTCPIDIERYIFDFEHWLSDLEQIQIKKYFEKAYEEGIRAAQIQYNKPVVRGRDGFLYSAADMDDAMMSGI